jgi:hypothetical protein
MSPASELDPVFVRPLRRPEEAPRRRPAPQLRARPSVLRLAGLLVGIVVLAAFAGRIAAFASQPVLITYRTGLEIQDLQQTLRKELAVNERLREDIRYLRSPAGVEQEARRRGWVLPGQVALAIIEPEAASGGAPHDSTRDRRDGVTPPPAGDTRPLADRIREAVDTCLAVFGAGRGSR